MTESYTLVYGLSANPIHQAHVDLVVDVVKALVARQLVIARTILVPVYRRNPVGSKRKDDLPDSFDHRFAMCQLAAQEIGERLAGAGGPVEVSRLEEKLAQPRTEPNYTLETLAVLQGGESAGSRLMFLLASDLVSGPDPEFGRWFHPEKLVQLATMVICPRPGYTRNEEFLKAFEQKGARFILLDDLAPKDMAASDIKERLEAGEDPILLAQEGLLPIRVAAYLKDHNLYHSVEQVSDVFPLGVEASAERPSEDLIADAYPELGTTLDILIIGAGLAGLMAARQFTAHGLRVMLVDKSSAVGGRLATCSVGSGRADYGTQFFTVRTPEFQRWVSQWLEHGPVYQWSDGWADRKGLLHRDGQPRYAVGGGMITLAEHLSEGLAVRSNTRVEAISSAGDIWRTRDEAGTSYYSRAIALTPPVPEALALLDAGNIELSPEQREVFVRIDYEPCLVGLYALEDEVALPEPGAIQSFSDRVQWIADNRRKGISPEATVLTIQATSGYSRQAWEEPDDVVLDALYEELRAWKPSATLVDRQLRRWRHSQPMSLYPERCLLIIDRPPLALAGDAFGGPRVEGAALSGIDAAEVIWQHLNSPSRPSRPQIDD